MFESLELQRDDILLKLPPETEQLTRTQSSGLEVATLQSQTYSPVYGEVISHGPDCRHVQIGNKAFFQIFTFSTAKERAYGDEMDKRFANEYSPVTQFAFKEDGNWYMIMRESNLYFIVDGEQIFPLNGFVIAKPVKQDIKVVYNNTNIIIADLSNKNYIPDQAIIVCSPDDSLSPSDLVQTLRHCDITIEEKYNNPVLAEDYFIIEFKNIISKFMDNKYEAGYKRVIVKPDQVDTTTSSGLINLEKEKDKLLTGKVTSVGKDCGGWQEGDTVLYARNSGMPVDDFLILNDIDIFAKIKP